MRQDWKQIVTNKLIEQVQPAFILVFGSYAKGTYRKDSDLDIAYFSHTDLSHYERFLLAGDIAEECKIDIDLVDIRKVDTVFAAQIFSTAEILACADENTLIKERMKALSMYVTLNEQRAEILRSINERGSIYGES
ncbi:type VII toxin-antitoxin system MntA family adenylyltransferase antitoxin [Aquibacillus albus]|uniref:Nucleotidyltransferase n=1 Tax=Aquibacillus albus TaxID=1168171 RepID=A0ABS2N0P0_9BACI|nr:nucleotidyltransferase domain-containing protein [Aquibacillus albus]MBM7571716.1 putative nucleotidyltransferase [Aquibacillus albus]